MVNCCGYEVATLSRIPMFLFGLSASGWLTFVVGFLSNVFSFDPVVRALSFLFIPWYLAILAGILCYTVGGLYFCLGGIENENCNIGKFFRSGGGCFAMIFVATLGAPLFAVATLLASALGVVEDVTEAIAIPNNLIEDELDLDLGILGDTLDSALNEVFSFVNDFIRGILYFIILFFFEKFTSAVRAQLIGSVTAVAFLALSLMFWPCFRPTPPPKAR